jgi:hypothetical protein
LPSERSELSCDKEIGEFSGVGRYASQCLIAADSGKNHTIALRNQTIGELSFTRGREGFGTRSGHKAMTWVARSAEEFLRTYIDMPSSAPTLFFYFAEVSALIPVRLGVVIVGNGV